VIESQLPQGQFNNFVRWAKTVEHGKVMTMVTLLESTMSRLRLTPDLTKAVKGLPDGSDQFDSGALKIWLNSLRRRGDRAAKAQVLAIYATIQSRLA
jgi:hypothetical protein